MSKESPPSPAASPAERTPLMEMLIIAAPVVASMTSYTLMQMLDKYMVAHIGPDPIYVGAQGNGGLLAFVPISIAMGMLTVINTYVSQHLGAKSPERAPAYCWAGLWMAIVYWLVLLVPFALMLPTLLDWIRGTTGDPAELAELARRDVLAASYGQILLYGACITMAARAVSQYFYGMHAPMVVLIATVAGNLTNFVLNSFLIYGSVPGVTGIGWLDAWFSFTANLSASLGIPRLEMAGAAIATVAGTVVELVIPLGVFLSGKYHRLYRTRALWRPNLEPIKAIFKIGWPGAVMFGNEMICWAIFMVAQVGHFGPKHSTAGWIAHQWMSLSFMPTVGISIAITAVVGKCMGMQRPDLARHRAILGLRVAVVYMTLCGLLFVVFRTQLIDLFLDPATDPADREQLVRLGSQFLIATAAFQFFDAIAMSLSGALRGAGDTLWPGAATIVLSWSIIVGGGWALVFWAPQLGSLGPWIAAAVYITLLAIAIWLRFQGGAWKNIKLVDQKAPVA